MIGLLLVVIIIPIVLIVYEKEIKEWGEKMKEKLKK